MRRARFNVMMMDARVMVSIITEVGAMLVQGLQSCVGSARFSNKKLVCRMEACRTVTARCQ